MIEIQEAVHIQCIQLSEFGYKNTYVKPSSQCHKTGITIAISKMEKEIWI